MSKGPWLLKRKRYDGSETIICRYSNREEAQDDADTMNCAYQSDNYYVEPYDTEKARGFFAGISDHG